MPATPLLLTALTAAVLLVVHVQCDGHSSTPNREQPKGYRPSDDEVAKIPDLTDPLKSKALRCSSCRAVAREIHERVAAAYKLRHGKPTTFEIADALDPMCRGMATQYGLLMKNNEPTTEFSRNKAITRFQGSWINTFVERRCGEIVDALDDDLIPLAKKHVESLGAFREAVCKEYEGSCKSRDEAVIEDL